MAKPESGSPVRAILSERRITLVDECSYDRIPDDIGNISHSEHHGNRERVESIDVGVEEEEVGTCDLENEVLCEVTGTESNALHPIEFVKTL